MRSRASLVLLAVGLLGGCHKEISSLDRKEAASTVSEAEFAINLRDWPRAEGLYAKATELCPDNGDYWMSLGMVRMRAGERDGARTAYKKALSAFKDKQDVPGDETEIVVREAYVLVLLGRADEARSLVDKARARRPDDRKLGSFVDSRTIDRIIADPGTKELSP